MTNIAKEILAFEFNLDLFLNSANTIVSHSQERAFETNKRHLTIITDKYSYEKDLVVDENDQKELLRKFDTMFYENKRKGFYDNLFSLRDLKRLCYCLYLFGNEFDKVEFFVFLLNENWKDSFMNGLLSYLLSNWNSSNSDSIKVVRILLLSHLGIYNGNRKKFVTLKQNIDFLYENGPIKLGKLVRLKQFSKKYFTDIFDITESCIGYSYYSKAIISYYENNYSDLSGLKELMTAHNNMKTNKILLPYFIMYADNYFTEIQQDELRSLAIAQIGDPSINSNWAPFDNASIIEESNLKESQRILNEWLTNRFITVFFEKCLVDYERKLFWLRYVKHIHSFKILGSRQISEILKQDSRIKDVLNAKYIQTNSTRRLTSALAMYIKDYVIIEFSDVGAVYIYKKDNSMASLLAQYRIDSIDSLKTPSLEPIYYSDTYYNYFRDEGRLVHNGFWQSRMDSWIQNKLKITV